MAAERPWPQGLRRVWRGGVVQHERKHSHGWDRRVDRFVEHRDGPAADGLGPPGFFGHGHLTEVFGGDERGWGVERADEDDRSVSWPASCPRAVARLQDETDIGETGRVRGRHVSRSMASKSSGITIASRFGARPAAVAARPTTWVMIAVRAPVRPRPARWSASVTVGPSATAAASPPGRRHQTPATAEAASGRCCRGGRLGPGAGRPRRVPQQSSRGRHGCRG